MRRTSRLRLFIPIIAAVSVFLVAELGVRGLADSLPESVEWYDAQTQVKVEQMDRYQARRRRADFVFAGTSMVFRGIRPPTFDRSGRERTFSYNAGLLAGVPPLMERWILEEVQPRLRPRVVVYGLSSLDFHERRYWRPMRSYGQAPATRKGVMGTLERIGANTLKLVKFRALLRDPKVWKNPPKSLPGEEGPVERARKSIGPQGFSPKTWTERGEEERIRMRDKVLTEFEISERGTRSIARIVRVLRRRDVDVVLVSMPVPRRYLEVHPNGIQDFEASERHMNAIARSLDVPLVDMSDAMPEPAFVDFTHLGEEGAERFSRKLRRRLRQLGY